MNRQSIHVVQEMIIGAFSHLSRVDDEFIKELIKKVSEEENGKETIAGFWAFSEIADCQSESMVQQDSGLFPRLQTAKVSLSYGFWAFSEIADCQSESIVQILGFLRDCRLPKRVYRTDSTLANRAGGR